jgi:hypothetical protein
METCEPILRFIRFFCSCVLEIGKYKNKTTTTTIELIAPLGKPRHARNAM